MIGRCRRQVLPAFLCPQHMKLPTPNYQLQSAYTLVQIIVTIAIISIMVAIVVGTYSLGSRYDTMVAENAKLTAVLRNARTRDFNGVVHYNGTDNVYPAGGYGVYLSRVNGTNNNGGNSNYTLFADFNENKRYDGGDELVERFEVAKDFLLVMRPGGNAVEALIIFKNKDVLLIEAAVAMGNWIDLTDFLKGLLTEYQIEVQLTGGSCAPVEDKKGRIAIVFESLNLVETLESC